MDSNFENSIKAALNNPPEFSGTDQSWENISTRIDESKNNTNTSTNPYAKWLPLLLLLGFIPSFFAGYFYNKNQADAERIQYMVDQQQVLAPIKIDSTFHKHVTVVYDTIYNHIVINKFTTNTITSSDQASHSAIPLAGLQNDIFLDKITNTISPIRRNHSFVFSPYSKSFNTPSFLTRLDQENPSNRLSGSRLVTYESDAPKTDLTKTVGPFSSLQMTPFSINEAYNLTDLSLVSAMEKRKNLDFYLLKMRPQSLALSASLGAVSAFNFPTLSLGFNSKIQAEIGYGQRFRFVIGAEWLKYRFDLEFENSDLKDLTDFPVPPPHNDGDLLHEIYGDFGYLQIPFGVKYLLLNQQKRLRPYIGIGLVSHKALRSNLSYEYLSIMSEYYVDQKNVVSDAFQIDDIWFNVGMELDLNRRWRFLLDVTSQLEMKSQLYRYDNHKYLKLNTGLQYQF